MSKDDDRIAIMFERIQDQNNMVLEAVSQMREQMNTLATKEELHAVADDVKTIKLAVTSTNRDLDKLEARVTFLEQAA